VAVIGGGMGGVATAWLSDHEWSVSLFEAKDKLGGNCDSRTITRDGSDFVVDLGAQFFHPATHPTYIALLELLDRDRSALVARALRRIEMPAGLCVLPLDTSEPYFSSTNLVRTPLHALDFAVYMNAARKMASTGDDDVTMADWVAGLRVSERFKTHILLPWLTASEGHPLGDTKRSSARAILQLFAPSHPTNPLTKSSFSSPRGGLQAAITAMAGQCDNTAIHVRTPIVWVEKVQGEWFAHSRDTRWGPFDAVVLNAPPWESKKLLARLGWADGLVAVLDAYEHLSHKLTIHADPIYVHRDRRNWALANVGVEPRGPGGGAEADSRSELSIWLGAGVRKPNGETLDVFKSWTTYRRQAPKEALFERTFQHSIKTPAMMDAARRLQSWQGTEGLWLAGHFTSGLDLQESALCSAMDVARSLCESSPRLAALTNQRTLRARGVAR
jgi:predicted NAD/FAD-binding protein